MIQKRCKCKCSYHKLSLCFPSANRFVLVEVICLTCSLRIYLKIFNNQDINTFVFILKKKIIKKNLYHIYYNSGYENFYFKVFPVYTAVEALWHSVPSIHKHVLGKKIGADSPDFLCQRFEMAELASLDPKIG